MEELLLLATTEELLGKGVELLLGFELDEDNGTELELCTIGAAELELGTAELLLGKAIELLLDAGQL